MIDHFLRVMLVLIWVASSSVNAAFGVWFIFKVCTGYDVHITLAVRKRKKEEGQ